MADGRSGTRATARDAAARDPKFQQLANELRRGILAGNWSPGSKLPTESQLVHATGFCTEVPRRADDGRSSASGGWRPKYCCGELPKATPAQPTRSICDHA